MSDISAITKGYKCTACGAEINFYASCGDDWRFGCDGRVFHCCEWHETVPIKMSVEEQQQFMENNP